MTAKKKMILPLQAWRGIFIIMIFVLHVCPELIPFLAGGNECISGHDCDRHTAFEYRDGAGTDLSSPLSDPDGSGDETKGTLISAPFVPMKILHIMAIVMLI